MTTSSVNRLQTAPKLALEGCLIVAAPKLQHALFERSVCLVVRHDEQGSVGIVLNRQLPLVAPGLWKHLAGETTIHDNTTLHFGGPHSGPVVALHDQQELAEFASGTGVYVAAQVNTLRALVSRPANRRRIKLIVGQAGWERGLLEQQLADGLWIPLPVTPELVFSENQHMWPQAMRQIGNHFVATITGAKGLPPNALAN